jgi:fimbrial isopeptide formation D2 family protein/uncharacterized repeat protein (TIGR01451 family)
MLRFHMSLHPFLRLLLCLGFLTTLSAAPLHAQIPTVVLQDVPTDVLIGEVFHFKLLFQAAATTGYSPFVELYLQYQGADCMTAPGPCDGLAFDQAAAVFANGNVPLTPLPPSCPFVLNFNNCPGPCVGSCSGPPAGFFGGLTPLALPGFQKVVLELPFGSFVPGQPDVEIDVAVRVHPFADVNVPLQIQARGGFRSANALWSPPPIVGPSVLDSVTPHILTVRKLYLGPEDETATGPNFPRQYKVEVEVANGQTVQNVEIEDCFPANLTPTVPPPQSGNCVKVPIGTVTGGSGSPDASATYNFFAPELDLSGQQVLDPSCLATSLDQASASADWTPTDTRDSFVTDTVTATHTLADKCLALQKSVSLVVDTGAPGPTPGDTLQYTLNFQVSDFRTIRNLVIDDHLSDGQTLLTATPPTLVIGDKFGGATGSFVGSFLNQTVVPSAPCQAVDPTINPQRIRFQVSALLATLSPLQLRHLAGILTGGRAGLPNGGPATGQIIFRVSIDDQYQRQPGTVEPFVDKDDPLLNCATATAQVLANVNAPAVPGSVVGNASDSTALKFRIVVGKLDKTIYAINGNPPGSLPPKVHPGDAITFRIKYPIPSTDAEQLKVVDFSPLPVLPVSPLSTLNPSCSLSIPPPNQAIAVDPLCSFLGPSQPVLSVNAADNSLTFDYSPDFTDPGNTPRDVDLLLTLKVSSAPFADGLQLTNEAYEQESNSFSESIGQAAIAQFTLCEPKLRVRKGVVRTNKPGALFSPSPPAPPGVTFALPGSGSFTGTINSSNVQSALFSDLSGVDGCDRVKYAVIIENLGCSSAFDVKVSDLVPSCMTSRFNLQVRKGNGAPFTCNGGLNCAALFSPFFGTPGITLDDTLGAGALAPFNATNGNNIAVITFDTQIGCNVPATGCCTNTGKLLNYAGVEGGPNHVGAGFSTPFPGASSPFSDDAKVCVQPKLTKSITATSEPHTGTVSGVTQLAIGEIVTYKLEVVVPEGSSPGMTITDVLPAALQWLPPCSVVKIGPITTTLNSLVLSGPSLTLNLGNVTNSANNPAPETITITCKALVLNHPANVKPALKPNSFSVKVGGVTYNSNVVQAMIVEPMGPVTKQELPSPVPGNAVYILGYTNNGTATAFNLTLLDTLPPGLTLSGPVSISPSSCTLVPAGPNQVKVTCPSVPVGGTVKVQFTVKGILFCKAFVNVAQLTYTSLPGPKGTGNVTPGASGAPNGERIYSSSASVTTNRCPDLVLTKTHTGNFPAGQNGTYTLTVTNTGNLASVPPDTVVDTLPPGFTFVSGGGNGWTCTANGQIVTCTSNTPIPPGGSSTFTIVVKAPCGSPATQNCATVATTNETDLSDNQGCDPTTVVSPVPGCTPPPPNMTAWWPFDETSGTIAADIAGAVHNDGTLQQGTTQTSGQVAGAVCFDGVNDLVEVPDEAEIDVDAGDFSIDAWIRTTASSGIRTIIDKRDHSPNPHGYAFFLVNGQLFLQMAVGTGAGGCSNLPGDYCTNFSIGGPNVADGNWHHVAVTVSRGNSQGGLFYVDGSPVPGSFNPTIRSQSLGNGAGARIGLRALAEGGGAQFDGCLDEIEIFKRVLSAGEVKAIFAAGSAGKCKCVCVAPPAHMVGWWPLDEGTGATSFQDLIGGNNATPFASPVGGAQAPQPVSGTVNGATHFPKFGNGLSGARVSPQGALATVGSADFTIDAWVEFQSAPANQPHYIVNKFDSVQNKGYALYVISPGIAGNERLEFKWGDGVTVTTVQTISPLTPVQWHHVAVTFARNVGGNALDIRLYVDGAQQGQQTGSPPGLSSLVNFVFLEVGWQPSTLDKPITIDELEIFNVALPQSDIQSIYDAGFAGKCK